MADLNPTRGHAQAGARPVLIISTNTFNHGPANLVFVLPLTRTDHRIPNTPWARRSRWQEVLGVRGGGAKRPFESPIRPIRRHCIQAATRSAIMIVVALVLERVTLGMIEASTTRNPSIPCTRQYWSTTAMGSDAGPIL